MNIFVDNHRTPPTGFVHVTSVEDAKEILANSTVDELSLDHGLGRNHPSGMDLIRWMIAHRISVRAVYVHTGNYLEKRAMLQALQQYQEANSLSMEVFNHPVAQGSNPA